MALARLGGVVSAILIGSCVTASAAPLPAGVILVRQPLASDGTPVAGVTTLRVYACAGAPAQAVEIRASSGDAAFDAAARDAVRRWRYVPALTGNSGQSEWLLVRFVALALRSAPLVRASTR